jgi:hypothetical protein
VATTALKEGTYQGHSFASALSGLATFCEFLLTIVHSEAAMCARRKLPSKVTFSRERSLNAFHTLHCQAGCRVLRGKPRALLVSCFSWAAYFPAASCTSAPSVFATICGSPELSTDAASTVQLMA